MIFVRAVVASVLWLTVFCHPARADEQVTFYGKTVDGWIGVLRAKTSTDNERRQSILALGYFGRDAKAAVPDLVEAARAGPLKGEATEALTRIEPHPERNIAPLIEQFLKDGRDHLTEMGAFGFNSAVRDSLVRIGGPAVPALLDVLRGPDLKMRVCAADVIGRIGPAANAAVPLLIGAIEHPDADPHAEIFRHYVVQALGRIGPDAQAAVPLLNQLLDKQGGDDFDLAIALNGIGVPPVRMMLDTFLRNGSRNAADLLARLSPKAREAAPSLKAALTEKRLQV